MGPGERAVKQSSPVIANITPGVRASDGILEEHQRRVAEHHARIARSGTAPGAPSELQRLAV